MRRAGDCQVTHARLLSTCARLCAFSYTFFRLLIFSFLFSSFFVITVSLSGVSPSCLASCSGWNLQFSFTFARIMFSYSLILPRPPSPSFSRPLCPPFPHPVCVRFQSFDTLLMTLLRRAVWAAFRKLYFPATCQLREWRVIFVTVIAI